LLALGVLAVLGPFDGMFDTAALLADWTARLGNGDLVLPLLLVGAQLVFLVYDYALSLMISFYLRRVRPSLSR